MPRDHRDIRAELASSPISRRPGQARDVLDWLLELARLAPTAPRMMLWILARLLTDEASPDALLIVADALGEAAAQVAFDGSEPAADGLRAIASLIGNEVASRTRRGDFW